jgi:hypothetical protein
MTPGSRLAVPALALLLAAACSGPAARGQDVRVVDDFEGAPAWSAHPADGVGLDITQAARDDGRGRALRLDFRFTGGGYAIARLETALDLPGNYAFRFRLKGDAPVNHLEFKLVDASGENVWWHVRRDVAWPADWETVRIRKRQIEFAWGPSGGGEIGHVAAIEFAVTAGSGGSGTVWIDDLELVALPVVTGPPPEPVATASTSVPGHPAAAVLDGDSATWWSADPGDGAPGLALHFGQPREYGGLTVSWAEGRHAADYMVETSDDGRAWETRLAVAGGNGGRDHLYLPETESQWLRLRPLPGKGAPWPAIAEIVVRPLEWSATRERFFMNIAGEAARGLYPRGFLDEPTAWTVVGVDRDSREGLLGADGALEAGPGGFSLEPFLWVGGQLITWDDVTATQRLSDDDLPLPVVTWESGPWRLEVSALGTGRSEQSSILARYVVENRGTVADTATLYLALRPFQVNPPVQFLNIRGGTARVGSIARDGRTILVDGRPRVRLLREPDDFGATTFAAGDVVADYLAVGRVPTAHSVADPFAAASAVAAYRLALEPGSVAGMEVLVPLYDASPLTEEFDWVEATAQATASWRMARDQFVITGPPAAFDAIATLKAQLGWILVNRAGAGIQPGARSYARSWIRDGALTGVALLRLGHSDAVRDFLEWYAPHQYESGKIPCVVDQRGADPVPEHDSTGEFIHLVTEYYRYTGDRGMLEAMWPRVLAGVRYLESLLAERTTEAYLAADKREFYGILPPSISHEGYAAKPMHSYWDDFFALRGLKDAAWLAAELADGGADRLAALRDRFAGDLGASVNAAMARHAIAYVPGCADLGDFDATSTTIALDPAAAQDILPAGALEQTFERYWEFFAARAGGGPWEAFTPYEIRTIGAFVRLGWRDRAQDLLAFFLDHRTPPGWRQWAEVVVSDTTRARFIGDMPHTWVGSDYVRSFLDMFVYERRAGGEGPAALVLAAGVPASWLEEEGVRVASLPTPFGKLGYLLHRDGDEIVMKIDAGLVPPPGGLLLAPPATGSIATIGGSPARLDDAGRVIVSEVPAVVRWRTR